MHKYIIQFRECRIYTIYTLALSLYWLCPEDIYDNRYTRLARTSEILSSVSQLASVLKQLVASQQELGQDQSTNEELPLISRQDPHLPHYTIPQQKHIGIYSIRRICIQRGQGVYCYPELFIIVFSMNIYSYNNIKTQRYCVRKSNLIQRRRRESQSESQKQEIKIAYGYHTQSEHTIVQLLMGSMDMKTCVQSQSFYFATALLGGFRHQMYCKLLFRQVQDDASVANKF
ncbi:hypothetical protein SS50377_22235 [Spironucleus salmonicida]|uniref:Uncharacterized protein n=1 Tax=Spironucleus salmonicida TaxID=348837 RepID=V6LDF6_9EUKA|nr:hypothetical protein SS50377_22235 [Spironucleus salmonicida]|eukprot:EST42273.1 Hypothetical protein SS50377_fx090 [Spironucleus salmonicida]